jgi:hypothetical protein
MPPDESLIRAELDAYRAESRASREEGAAFRSEIAAYRAEVVAFRAESRGEFVRLEGRLDHQDGDIATIIQTLMRLTDENDGES